MSQNNYIPTVGVETHVQLKTKTKLFAAVGNDARRAAPNTLISHICVAMPGALPVLNKEAINICARAAFALNTMPQKFSKFERKHYFYPDLPKGYQITQYEDPIIKGGFVEVSVDGRKRRVNIERGNLEEDAGKNTHPAGADYSLVDLNRAGTPLLEIVSQPDMHSPAEAKAFARELYLLMKYANVTDGDLYHGHIRFDVNVSIGKDPKQPGTRAEVKNLNSFRSVEAAVAYEVKRQKEILEKGGIITQETRGWDDAKQKTFSQRTKEEAEDYRYMPEPDVPPVIIDEAHLAEQKAQLPILPSEIRSQLSKVRVETQVIEDVLDRPSIVKPTLDVLEAAGPEEARRVVFWLIQAEPSDEQMSHEIELEIDPQRLIALSKMVDSGDLNSTAAKRVFDELLSTTDDPQTIAQRLNLLQVSDETAIERVVTEVIAAHPLVVEDIKNGQIKAIGFLVGQVMTKTKGQANPAIAQQIIKKLLNI